MPNRSRYKDSKSCAYRSTRKCAEARFSPALPMDRARSGSSTSVMIAAARASAEPGVNNNPVSPSPTCSTGPPCLDAITAFPAAMASRTTNGQGSGSVEGKTNTSKTFMTSRIIATIIADDEIPAEVIGRDCIPEAHHEMHLIIENTADSQEVNTVSLLRHDLRGIDQEQLALPAAHFPYHSD